MKHPTIPPDLHLVKKESGKLENGQNIENSAISEASFSESLAAGVSVDGCRISTTDLSNSKFKKLTVTDTILDHCQLFGLNADGAGIQRVEALHCPMSGIVLSDCLIKDVRFKDCKVNLGNLRFTKFMNVDFQDCVLTEADFQNAYLKNVKFEDCDLTKADFSQAKCEKVDLRSSQLNEVKGLPSLSGAIISGTQLISLSQQLAGQLGIIVSDEY